MWRSGYGRSRKKEADGVFLIHKNKMKRFCAECIKKCLGIVELTEKNMPDKKILTNIIKYISVKTMSKSNL